MSACLCGSGLESDACCAPLLAGKPAPTAEALMRARYTAYASGDLDYVEKTCVKEIRSDFNRLEAERFIAETKWLGLEISRVVEGGPQDETGLVEFVFRYSQKDEPYAQHELATFCREDGAWVYKDSEVNPKCPPLRVTKIGRNDPCSCNSGKKYKKCCGK